MRFVSYAGKLIEALPQIPGEGTSVVEKAGEKVVEWTAEGMAEVLWKALVSVAKGAGLFLLDAGPNLCIVLAMAGFILMMFNFDYSSKLLKTGLLGYLLLAMVNIVVA